MDLNTAIGFAVCFIGSAAVALNFNVPLRAAPTCGCLGIVAWFGQIYLGDQISLLASNFIAAFVVALLSELMARVQRLPVTCLAVPGVIPLVPGFSAYNAMYGYVTEQYDKANSALLQTVLVAGAISAALATAGALVTMLPGQKPWHDPQSPVDDTVLRSSAIPVYPSEPAEAAPTTPSDSD